MMRVRSSLPAWCALVFTACSSSSPSPASPSDDAGADAAASDDLGSDATNGTDGTFVTPSADGSPGDDGAASAPCANDPAIDGDHDGFTGAQGDCNDCDPDVNPGAYDVPGDGVDEDCDGKADDEPAACDTGLAVDAADPTLAAKAIGVCRKQSGATWGLVSAAWVYPDGTTGSNPTLDGCPASGPPNPLSHGLLATFGANGVPRDGKAMLAISSGAARAGETAIPAPGSGMSPQDGAMCTACAAPAGFPKASPSCPGVTAKAGHVYDGMALELHIKVPTNASALSFDFNFFSPEFPQYVCNPLGYNDQFVALLFSAATSTPADHNVSFDAMGDSVNVNSAFMQVCTPLTLAGVSYACPLGPSLLAGTGITSMNGDGNGGMYIAGGATGWLTTQAAVVHGETITLRFGIWDAGDNEIDSTTLIDHVTWTLRSGTTPPPAAAPPVTTRPPK